jgi:arginine/lysine/histidine transporter system substrate-binding protein
MSLHNKVGSSNLILVVCAGLLVSASVAWHMFKSPKTDGNSNILIVGTSGDFPPFTYVENGKLVGFDVDLVEEIAARLGKKIELKNMPFSTLLPSLQLGNLQVVASGVTETPERAQQVLFTTPYIENNPLVIVSLPASPAKTIQDLFGKEVIVNDGYTADLYMSKITGPLIKRLKSPADAFLALKSGRAFAFVTAQNTIAPVLAQYGSQAFHLAAISDTEEPASLAIAPQYKTLQAQIQKAQDDMKQDGTLEQLKKKWGL